MATQQERNMEMAKYLTGATPTMTFKEIVEAVAPRVVEAAERELLHSLAPGVEDYIQAIYVLLGLNVTSQYVFRFGDEDWRNEKPPQDTDQFPFVRSLVKKKLKTETGGYKFVIQGYRDCIQNPGSGRYVSLSGPVGNRSMTSELWQVYLDGLREGWRNYFPSYGGDLYMYTDVTNENVPRGRMYSGSYFRFPGLPASYDRLQHDQATYPVPAYHMQKISIPKEYGFPEWKYYFQVSNDDTDAMIMVKYAWLLYTSRAHEKGHQPFNSPEFYRNLFAQYKASTNQ